MPALEPGECFRAALLDALKQRFGDSDALVVIADLGLVMPEHRKLAIAADAVQPQLENFAAAPTGDDDDFPDIAQPPIVRIVGFGERLQVCVVREGLGDVVAERIAGCLRVRSPAGNSMMNDLFSPISEARPDSRAR